MPCCPSSSVFCGSNKGSLSCKWRVEGHGHAGGDPATVALGTTWGWELNQNSPSLNGVFL